MLGGVLGEEHLAAITGLEIDVDDFRVLYHGKIP
jgi:hypothetical protein